MRPSRRGGSIASAEATPSLPRRSSCSLHRTSTPFTFDGPDGSRETLEVTGGSNSQLVIGILAVSLGGATAFVGLTLLELIAAFDSAITPSPSAAPLATFAWSATGGGAFAIVAGIVAIQGSKTTVTQSLGAPQGRPPPPDVSRYPDASPLADLADRASAVTLPLPVGSF